MSTSENRKVRSWSTAQVDVGGTLVTGLASINYQPDSFRKVVLGNNWNHAFYHYEGDRDDRLDLKEGTWLRVEWPDGARTTECLVAVSETRDKPESRIVGETLTTTLYGIRREYVEHGITLSVFLGLELFRVELGEDGAP